MLYIRSITRFILISLALLGLSVSSVSASTIIGGDLLDQAGANQLESWLGVGSQTFTSIYDGTTGATAASWHSAVDGIENTISIYDALYGGTSYLIGGYRSVAPTSSSGDFIDDADAFIFNLTSLFQQTNDNSYYQNNPVGDKKDMFDHVNYFPSFGGGYDIHGGIGSLGSFAYVNGGYTYGAAGPESRGSLNILGLLNNPYSGTFITVAGLETYTFAPSAVPVPAAVWLFSTGILGLVGFNRRKTAMLKAA
jgi:hypothetical protein